jgi:hypothetical protein
MEGCMIRGPLAMLEHSVLKMGAKIYGPTTLGPYCKVGGELNNVVIFATANKAHDGFFGNAVGRRMVQPGSRYQQFQFKSTTCGEGFVNAAMNRFEQTGLTFVASSWLITSKCGINTMFSAGTVVGVSANVFGSGFPRNMIPGFSWGEQPAVLKTFQLPKVFEASGLMMERRGN